jgi:hypothetical protein
MKKGDYVSCEHPISGHIEGEVMWVIDNTASIQLPGMMFHMADLTDVEAPWIVVRESVPSYQSSVADMSDDQLKASIEALRSQRIVDTTPKVKVRKERATAVDKSDPMAVALASMAPEAKAELMKKLGMVD